MNHKTLKHIAQNAESLDAGSVQDLVDLTKQFPYFAWPYALLARHYHNKQDYRTEALMHQAAMRIHDRSWLFSFTHETDDSNIQTDIHSANVSNADKLSDAEKSNRVASSFNEQPTQQKTVPKLSDAEKPNPEESAIDTQPTRQFEPIIEENPIPNKEITPPVRSQPIAEEPNEKPIRKPIFSPATMHYDLERIFSGKDTEDNTLHTGKASNDFYSWLNGKKNQPTGTPTPSENSNNAPAKSTEHQKSIIENFLLTKPSISRPKQEFFKPEKAQKKGEQLTSAIVTETLARIYLKQDNPQKAIWAYQQLQLKFPEKKTYFANLISQIEKEQNKS